LVTSFWRLDTVIGEPRSDTNTNGDLPSTSRWSRRNARSSRPASGCVDGVPCFARVTASVAAWKSTWVHCRSHSSDAHRPCRKQDHGRVPVWTPVALAADHQPLDLGLREVFPGAQYFVARPTWRLRCVNFP